MSIYISNYIKKLQDNLEKKVLRGNDIIELTSSKQLNLFILKNIYDAWNKNFEKNKIIYFNYENKEILSAVTSLKNILSNHIEVDIENLKDLIKKSIIELIEYVFYPKNFIKKDILKEIKLAGESINRRSKFFIDNKKVFNNLIESSKEKDLNSTEMSQIISSYSFEINQELIEEIEFMLDCKSEELKKIIIEPVNYKELFDCSENDYKEIVTRAKRKNSFQDAAYLILENTKSEFLDERENLQLRSLLNEIKKNYT